MVTKSVRYVPVVVLLLLPVSLNAAELKPSERDFFEKKVRPLLVAKCYKCHSAKKKQEGKLVLDTKAGWEIGGESGAAIVPGKPEKSLLVEAIRFNEMEMPPKKKLADAEIAILVRWVRMGAPDPRTDGGPKTPHGIDVAATKGADRFTLRLGFPDGDVIDRKGIKDAIVAMTRASSKAPKSD